LSEPSGGAKAPAQQAMLVKLLQPLRIVDVGFSPRYVLHISSIYKKHFEASRFQNFEDRYPVHTRGLHRDRFDSYTLEPVRHFVKISAEASKRSHRPGILVTAYSDDMKGGSDV